MVPMRSIESFVRFLTPRWLLVGIKRFHIFNNLYGQLKTKDGLLTNGAGEYVPWFTFPAIEFLRTLDFSKAHVFEFGSGASSLYWLSRAHSVASVEHDFKWFEMLKQRGASAIASGRWSLQYAKDDVSYARTIRDAGRKFDVIVIDGAGRRKCAEQAIEALAANGLIILDNSEWYPQTCGHLRDAGFSQIDFAGFAPQNAFTHCTSIFVRELEALRSRTVEKPAYWTPLGGRSLAPHGAYDDAN